MNPTDTHPVIIRIPTPLRAYTNEQAAVSLEGQTVGEALDRLVGAFPKLKPHLFGEDGQLRSFVNVYKGDEDIRYLDREATPLAPGDELSLVPSIAGGGGGE